MKEKENDHSKFIIIGLSEFNHDDFMEVFYHILISEPNEILEYNELPEYKIEKLNYILKYFEDKEKYEKCIKIKEMQQMIKNTINV